MPRQKQKAPLTTAKKPRNPRRSDEEMEKLLIAKLQKVQERIVKKYGETYYHIGYLLSIITGLDKAKLTLEEINAISQKTKEGEAVVKRYASKIILRQQAKEQLDAFGNGCAYDYEI